MRIADDAVDALVGERRFLGNVALRTTIPRRARNIPGCGWVLNDLRSAPGRFDLQLKRYDLQQVLQCNDADQAIVLHHHES